MAVSHSKEYFNRSAVLGTSLLFMWLLIQVFGLVQAKISKIIFISDYAILHLLSYCLIMVLPLLFAIRYCPYLPNQRAFISKPLKKGAGYILIALGALVIINYCNSFLVNWLNARYSLSSEPCIVGLSPLHTLCNILSVTIFPAVLEELYFRGAVLSICKPLGPIRAALLSSIIFMVCHGSIIQWIPALLGGILFSLLTITTGSLRYSIVTHTVYNSFVLCTYLWKDFLIQTVIPILLVLFGCLCFIPFFQRKMFAVPKTAPSSFRAFVSFPLLLALLLHALNGLRIFI